MMLLGYSLYQGLSDSMYLVLAIQFLWVCTVLLLVRSRVNQKRFKSEEAQDAFLADVGGMLEAGDFEGAAEYVDGIIADLPR